MTADRPVAPFPAPPARATWATRTAWTGAALLALAGGARLVAQTEPVDLEVITALRDEGLHRSQVMDTLWHLTDLYGPRLTNSPQQRQAAEWARARLESYGLQQAQLEPWGEFGLGWSFQRCQVEMTAPACMPLIAYPKAWTLGLEQPVEGEVVWVDADTPEELEAYRGQLAGRIVLAGDLAVPVTPFEPLAERYDEEGLAELVAIGEAEPGEDRASRRAEFREQRRVRDARNALFVEEGVAVVVEPDGGRRNHYGVLMLGSGGSYDPAEPRALPQVVVSGEQYNRLLRLVQHGQSVSLRIDVRTSFHDEDLVAHNVVAELPGTDLAEEVVMIGAHFDSWHPGTGATDNGSSCAVMIEAMRLLTVVGAKPRRTIRVALWTGEEQGLLGSKAYVKNHFGDPATHAWLPERDTLAAYFNLDNGSGRIRGVYLEENAAVAPIFAAWLLPFADLGASTLTLRGTGGTDHLSFQEAGLPGFQFIQDPMDYSTRTHHTNMDLYERVHEDDVRQAATIVAAFAYHAAHRDELLPRKPLPPLPPPAEPTAEAATPAAGGDAAPAAGEGAASEAAPAPAPEAASSAAASGG